MLERKSFEELVKAAVASAGSRTLPPIDKWNPALSGDIDITITRRGDWIHEGDPITREKLVTLFASILKREGEDYFLVTPVEKWRLRVEDVPFTVSSVNVVRESGQQALLFSTSTGDRVVAGREHPIRVCIDKRSLGPAPYLLVRGGMEGRMTRSVFYRLAEIAEQVNTKYGVWSMGEFFSLE